MKHIHSSKITRRLSKYFEIRTTYNTKEALVFWKEAHIIKDNSSPKQTLTQIQKISKKETKQIVFASLWYGNKDPNYGDVVVFKCSEKRALFLIDKMIKAEKEKNRLKKIKQWFPKH